MEPTQATRLQVQNFFRILNTFLDLPTLPQQVVAKLKQATLEMLGEGADAAQKMTRMINPEVGQV